MSSEQYIGTSVLFYHITSWICCAGQIYLCSYLFQFKTETVYYYYYYYLWKGNMYLLKYIFFWDLHHFFEKSLYVK